MVLPTAVDATRWLVAAVAVPESWEIDLAFTAGSGAVSAFLSTLVVGAILVALAPGFTERKIASVRANPVGCFGVGVVALLGLLVVTVVLVLTIVGILVAAPLLVLAVVLWAAGSAIAFLAIATGLVGDDGDWLVPLLLASLFNAVLTVTVIGGLLSFCIGAAGFGAIISGD